MQRADIISVPLDADNTESPIVRFGVHPASVFFQTRLWTSESAYESSGWGRVTFESLDSIRCCQGEFTPYKVDRTADQYQGWVYEIRPSRWLNERHQYENGCYDKPLLGDYFHYLFRFHDEFVEAIAAGIWLEKVGAELSDEISADHPLNDLPVSLPANSFVHHQLRCEVRINPRPVAEIVEASKLCSQKLFQFYWTIDGQYHPSYAALLRTVRGRPITRMGMNWTHSVGTEIHGVATVDDLMPTWEQYVRKIAERRREMGKKG